ncbi:MAG: four helix bundle protein [Mongoliitalea sp.]
MSKEYNLEERLIDFAVSIIHLSDSLPKTKAGGHLGGQLLRSGTSPALNYGEAQSSKSRKDFIHKFRVILKELRESLISIKIIRKAQLECDTQVLNFLFKESNELIAIFVKSLETAQKNQFK